tara:strand:- start:9357 stop:10244 length:888 start_codon:yes stop_codon:yes gene_type:complete
MGKRAARQQAATMAEMNRMAQEQFDYFQAEKRAQQEVVDQQRQQYEAFDFQNPFEGVQNPYASLQTNFENLAADARNVYAGMENPYEDLTVDMRAAEFQAEQGAQQRANILSALRGAAGGSGIAALAQSLANQGAIQAQQISANIAQQERQNQRLSAQGAMAIQQAERAGEAQVQQMQIAGAQRAQALGISRENLIAQGGFKADVLQRQGEAALQAAEFGREGTLLGMEYGLLAGANQAEQRAMANQMSGMGMQANMYGQQAAQGAQMFSTALGMATSIALAPATGGGTLIGSLF